MTLTRGALKRVLESKLRAEIAVSRGRSRLAGACLPPSPWGEDLRLFGEGSGAGLDCDSLERIWLAGAVNEMFHVHESGAEGELLREGHFGQWLDIVESALAGSGRVTFATSGSTGEPKRCMHSVADLTCEISVLAKLFSDRMRIVATVPAHHIYGFLFTAMLPDTLGAGVLEAAGMGAGDLAARLLHGDLVVSFPDHWRYLEQSLSCLPAGVTGTTSTAPCPRWLIDALCRKGLAGMTEIYGSSETAGIGTRTWPDQAYTLMPQWRAELDLMDEATALVHAGGRRVSPMDGLTFLDERRFAIEGRVDHAVQVGGTNVFPDRIAKRLVDHPFVAAAAVRLMRPDEGNRLKAFIVLSDEGRNEASARPLLSRWIESEFAAAERPKALTFGSAIPCGTLGKLADW